MVRVIRSLRRAHDVLNHDFCPWANRWILWIKHPLTCVLAAAAAALTCGLLVNPAALVILAGILLVAVLGVVWPWIAVRGLSGEAVFQQTRCRLGQSVTVRLQLTNRSLWPVWGLSIRHGFHRSGQLSAGIALARVNGWSDVEFEWPFRPAQRGSYPLESPRIDTGFPFGLVHASVPITVRNELLVWPSSVVLDAMPDAAEIQTRDDQLTDRRAGHCGDMLGTRPFREGDSLRRVHWLQTARQGRMIVIERQAPATCAIRLVVDVSTSAHTLSGDRSSLEQTLSLAASVLESLHRQHALVELVVDEQQITVTASESSLRRGLDALARVPLLGVPCQHACHFDRPSRLLPTLAVTTDRALNHHRGHRHVSFGERYIVVRANRNSSTEPVRPGCDCHAWFEVDTEESLHEVLPGRWRRACHAA